MLLLTANSLTHFLIDRGLHQPRLGGGWRSHDRRVQQPQPQLPGHSEAIAGIFRETAAAMGLAGDRLAAKRGELLLAGSQRSWLRVSGVPCPGLQALRSGQHILVTELLPDGENLKEYHRRLGAFPLASLHAWAKPSGPITKTSR